MTRYIDIERWARRDAFEYFRGFDKPYFNVGTRLDVARLKASLPEGRGLTLACYFIAMRLVNAHEPFQLRLEGGRVRIVEVVNGSTTVLREDDESFGFAYLPFADDFATFARTAGAAIEAARRGDAVFEPRTDEQSLVHFTTLPWLHFTSFSHARNWGREDSIPKIAFGRVERDGERQWMPCSIEVHHALMDGVHVGRFVQAFEAALGDPDAWL